MTDKRIIWLRDSATRQRAIDAVKDAPDGYRVTIQPPGRTVDQNSALHARLSELADQCEWGGQRWSAEHWKRAMVAGWARATGRQIDAMPSVDGQGVELIPLRTSKLSKAECSELIEYINAWAAMNAID